MYHVILEGSHLSYLLLWWVWAGVKQECSAVLEEKFKQLIEFTIYVLELEVA
jgi:hypothetical protein